MPLAGGDADKAGNRYELLITIRCMIDVMDEDSDSVFIEAAHLDLAPGDSDGAAAIRLEPPGDEGEGIEFRMLRHGVPRYYQVKRQIAKGQWSLADLKRKRVLDAFLKKLDDPAATCIFASANNVTALDELSDRARDAVSAEEFTRDFLGTSKDLREAFTEVRRAWGDCSEEIAYDALRRVEVRVQDEKTLRENVISLLRSRVDGDPATALDVLAQYALDSVHDELTAHDLWRHLDKRGHPRRAWARDSCLAAKVDTATDQYLASLRDASIGGQVIDRVETDAVLARLADVKERRCIILTGEAGGGKTGVVRQVVERLRSEGWPVLVCRIDRVKELDLPASLVAVLDAVAQKRPCLLVLDQVDTVSLASGRHPELFDTLRTILDEALMDKYGHVRVLLACRSFDLQNDHRLRKLVGDKGIAQEMPIGRLPVEKVRTVVRELGLDAEALTTKQVDLLSVPLHLGLLAEVVESGVIPEFSTAKDLFDLYWERKQDLIRGRTGAAPQWTSAIDALCDYVSARQTFFVPHSVVDEHRTVVRVMALEHVLVDDDRHYSFFHESFFDYAYARRFVARGHTLTALLANDEQHLFRRAQVRQILRHERDDDNDRYLRDLDWVLTDPSVRFHLKEAVCAVLGSVLDPRRQEWDVIASLVENLNTPLADELWRMLRGAPAWIAALDDYGVLARWLASGNDQLINETMHLLWAARSHIPVRVAALLDPYVGVSDTWDERLRFIMRGSDLAADRSFLDLFLRLIDQGTLDDARGSIAVNSDFWSFLYGLPEKRPGWACEVIAHYFDRRVAIARADRSANPFEDAATMGESVHHNDALLRKSAAGAPARFVELMLPFMEAAAAATANRVGSGPFCDTVWGTRRYGGLYRIDVELLAAMETALAVLAANDDDPSAVAAWAAHLAQSKYETMHYLLMRAYAANPVHYADDAIDYLCAAPDRLLTGYYNWYCGVAVQLLKVATPHCSSARLALLEEHVLRLYPTWEQRTRSLYPVGARPAPWHRGNNHGYMQYKLLAAIDPARRSPAATHRWQELERKFGLLSQEEPPPLTASDSRSPIPTDAVGRMSDEQWLRAMHCYGGDIKRHRDPLAMLGGPMDVAQLLRQRAQAEPERFAALADRMPDDAHVFYFQAIVEGIAETDATVDTMCAICRRCHALPDRPCGAAISRLVARHATRPWPDDILDMAAWYAVNAHDPIATDASAEESA